MWKVIPAALIALAGLISIPSQAKADVITCPYPGVGHKVNIQVIVTAGGFYCDDPIEVNGAHMHCQEGNGGIGFSGGATGPGAGGLTNTFGFGSFQVGASVWDCGWVCPPIPGDPNILYSTIGPPAAQPNPPGAWKDKLRPSACHIYARGGPYDSNSLPPAGMNPFYETDNPQPQPDTQNLPDSGSCPAAQNNNPACTNPSPIQPPVGQR